MTLNRITRLMDRLFPSPDSKTTQPGRQAKKNRLSHRLSHRKYRTRLQLESLEERRVMTAGLGPVPDEVAAASPMVYESMPTEDLHAAEVRVTDKFGTLSRSEIPAIGVVTDLRNSGTCTGTLISSRHVLTAAHCVRVNRPEATINLGQRDVRFIVGGQGGAVYASQGYVVGARWDARTIGTDTADDIAIVTLDRPVVGVTPIPVATSAPAAGSWIYLIGFGKSGNGYYGDFDSNLNRNKNWGVTRVDQVSQGLISWRYDYGESNTAPGDSGGPQLACNSQGANCQIVSVTSGGNGSRYGSWSFSTRVDPFAGAIRQLIQSGTVRMNAQPTYGQTIRISYAQMYSASAANTAVLQTASTSRVLEFNAPEQDALALSEVSDNLPSFHQTPPAMPSGEDRDDEHSPFSQTVDSIFGSEEGLGSDQESLLDQLAAF